MASTTRAAPLHFNRESNSRRQNVLAGLGLLPFTCLIAISKTGQGIPHYEARNRSLQVIVSELQNRNVPQLIIESRSNDKDDIRLIIAVRDSRVPLYFEFRIRKHEPLLWIPDAILWAYGAGSHWRQAALPLISQVITTA
jgi:hypothetical protein